MNQQTDGFDPGDDEKIISVLKKWQGGVLSDELFTSLAWVIPQPTVETVILREKNGRTEVLLVPRPPHDQVWPNVLHSPGQALRYMDYKREDQTPLNGPFERVQKQEITTPFVKTPEFVGVAQYMTKRGPEAVHVFLAQITDETTLPSTAVWHPVDDLENLVNFMSHQITPIRMAEMLFNSK